ncbi:MAG: zinc metallopeptidase [Alphaproteobacteria bacterium]|nr:zinc metallopeptidase [Alphaproteobacteria bacterium]
MIFVVLGALLVLLIVAPQWWVRRTLRRHADERADFPGTGGELARHLLDRAGLSDVKVEVTPDGDHYDGAARAVRLTSPVHDGRSVTAVAVATHEVGHALQHAEGMPIFHWRTRLARVGMVIEKVGSVILLLTPLLGVMTRAPVVVFFEIGIGLALLGSRVVVHLVTLPVELDASFRRALPLIRDEGYLPPADVPAAESVLKAAAWTYVAAALISLIDVTRWIRVLR